MVNYYSLPNNTKNYWDLLYGTSTNPVPAKKQAETAELFPQKPVETPPVANPVAQKEEPQKAEPKQQTSAPVATFDKQTQAWFGIDEKEWATLSEDEKQNKSDIALSGMIDAYNAEQDKLKTGKRMTVADQYSLYIARCNSKEEVIRLSRTVKAMDKDNQLPAFKNAYKYQNEEFRDIAERILAVDYTQLHEDNVVEAARETRNFKIENQEIAAQNAPKAVVHKQGELIDEFMSRKNEKIDFALSEKVGEFGINKDGTINKEIQLNCFKKISTTEFQSALENTAKNIYKLDAENQKPATQIIVCTKNAGAIEAAKSQIQYCSQENKTEIETTLNNSCTTSNVQEVETSKLNTVVTENKTSEAKIQAVKDSIKSNSPVLIKENVKAISNIEKISLLRQCPNNPDVLKAILASNPSKEVLALIDEEYLKKVGYKSMISEICFLSASAQTYIVKESAAAGNLDLVKRNFLTTTAKITYDKLEKQEKRENKVMV